MMHQNEISELQVFLFLLLFCPHVVHFTIIFKCILFYFTRLPLNRVEHIVGNLVMQLLLGIPLELVHKGFEVGMVYLAGVLAGERRVLVCQITVKLARLAPSARQQLSKS